MKINKFLTSLAVLVLFVSSGFCDAMESLLNPEKVDAELLSRNEIIIKAGLDFSGYADTNINVSAVGAKHFPSDENISFAAEYFRYFGPYTAAGAGISAMIPRSLEDVPGKYGFAPVYLSLKIRSWPIEPGMYGYVSGQIGYNLFYGNSAFEDVLEIEDNGLYYGFGFGIAYNWFLVEALFSINKGTARDTDSRKETSIEYSKWTLYLGYKI